MVLRCGAHLVSQYLRRTDTQNKRDELRLAIANITGGGLSGGYAKYLRRILPLLEASQSITELLVLVPPKFVDAFQKPSETVEILPHRTAASSRAVIKEFRPDLVFVPTARCLEPRRRPEVVMVRNMEPLMVPFGGNSMTECVKNLGRAFVAHRACRAATRVIAVSEHVRGFLVNKWHLPAGRIGVVYHGIDLPNDNYSPPKPAALGALQHRFLFTAGSIRPARGLEDLIQALPPIRASVADLQLVVAGKPDASSNQWATRCKRMASELGVADHIWWPGQLDEQELAWCFRNCASFVTTSRAEACPNTALEAMSFGCPIVSTSQEPMPEFFRESALYYAPRDYKQLSEQVCRALRCSEGERRRRHTAAVDRARSFRWEDTAAKTLEEFERARQSYGRKGRDT